MADLVWTVHGLVDVLTPYEDEDGAELSSRSLRLFKPCADATDVDVPVIECTDGRDAFPDGFADELERHLSGEHEHLRIRERGVGPSLVIDPDADKVEPPLRTEKFTLGHHGDRPEGEQMVASHISGNAVGRGATAAEAFHALADEIEGEPDAYKAAADAGGGGGD